MILGNHFSTIAKLILPLLMTEWESIQDVLPDSPVGKVFIHQGFEIVVVVLFQEVQQLVDDDVFQAIFRFLSQFQIDPDALGEDIASAPFGFHLFDRPLGDLYSDYVLPFDDQGLDSGFQPGPIPLLQH
jgi:hypothetical protein